MLKGIVNPELESAGDLERLQRFWGRVTPQICLFNADISGRGLSSLINSEFN